MIARLDLLLAPLRQHPARSTVSIVAIAVGVALGLAIQLINATAVSEFSSAARALAGRADLIVRGPRSGFDESVYPGLARTPGVVTASPALEVDARVAGTRQTLRVIGIDVFRAARIQPALLGLDADLLDMLRTDTIFLSPAALASLGVSVGQTIELQAGLTGRVLRVAGTTAAGEGGAAVGVMDIGAAQALFHRPGRLTRVDLALRAGTDPAALAARLALPAGVVATRVEAEGHDLARMTRAYRVNLDVLALVALFTGSLLVFSTQALSVARRRAEIALLRVVGFTRRQVAGLVLAQGALIGVVGAVLGTAGGVALAAGVLHVMGSDLGAGYFSGLQPRVVVGWEAAVVFGVLGVIAAVCGSLAPAIEAASAAPTTALRSGDDARAFRGLQTPVPGVVAIVAGAGCVFLPPVAGLPIFGYAAIALLLLGTIALLPRIVAVLLAAARPPRAVAGRLALERLRASPAQAAVSLSAIVAAVSLAVAMAVMVSSFRHSLDDWLQGILPADLYLRANDVGDSGFLSVTDQRRITETAGVRQVEFLRRLEVIIEPGRPRVAVLARDRVDEDPEHRLPLIGPAKPGTRDDAPGDAWISEAAAAIQGWRVGQRIDVPLGGRRCAFRVAGVWRDYARQSGAILIDRSRYVAFTGDRTADDAGIWLRDRAALSSVRAAIERLAPDAIETLTPEEVRTRSLAVFDRTFAVTYALEIVAVLIGLLGLSSAMGAEVVARRREFGMLRHLGVTRREIATILAAEGAIAAVTGLTVGAVLGYVISLILIHVVNRQSFHWGMTLHVPWAGIAAFFCAMIVAASATAIIGGRQAMSGSAVRAVRDDW
ncbi:MAG: FtsX-like permease family protein [Betaproteobacteria bacterium]|nr:FtsX-like permease family protein [Betaproteobacteria bacterium]